MGRSFTDKLSNLLLAKTRSIFQELGDRLRIEGIEQGHCIGRSGLRQLNDSCFKSQLSPFCFQRLGIKLLSNSF